MKSIDISFVVDDNNNIGFYDSTGNFRYLELNKYLNKQVSANNIGAIAAPVGEIVFNKANNSLNISYAGTWYTVGSLHPHWSNTKGATSSRPAWNGVYVGFMYFDTTLNKPIWWDGSKWIDATGADV